MKHLHYILFFLLLLCGSLVHAQYITTIAGNGTYGFGGDNGPATNAMLAQPRDIALDDSGNVFIADLNNNCIRVVNKYGVINSYAGIAGVGGYSGDSVAATSATLGTSYGIATDRTGNVYICDYFNHRIRKVNTLGIITTIAGNGVAGSAGDGGPATGANLNKPWKIAADRWGRVYISEVNNERIRMIDTSGIITAIAGTGIPGYSGDGGPATAAQLHACQGVAVDTIGNVYFIDNSRIRKISPDGIINTIAGSGTPGYSGDGGDALLADMRGEGLAVDESGNLYTAELDCNCVRKIDRITGKIDRVVGLPSAGGTFTGDGGPAINAGLSSPMGVRIDREGHIYVADLISNRIRKTYQHTEGLLTEGSTSNILVYTDKTRAGVWVDMSSCASRGELVVTDIRGRLVARANVVHGALQFVAVDVPGVYVVAVIAGGNRVNKQVVISGGQ